MLFRQNTLTKLQSLKFVFSELEDEFGLDTPVIEEPIFIENKVEQPDIFVETKPASNIIPASQRDAEDDD